MNINDPNVEEVNTPFGVIHIVKGFPEPMLIGKEIAIALGYNNEKRAIVENVPEECKFIGKVKTDKTREFVLINRKGLYLLSMKSTKPMANQFCDWVANVLVQIADHGSYTIGDSPQDQFANAILNPDMNSSGEYISEEDAYENANVPHNPYEVITDGRMVYEALLNYCSLCKLKFGFVINEFVRDYNAMFNTNLRSMTTRAYRNGDIEKDSIFDYIEHSKSLNKAYDVLMLMTDKYFHFMEYMRRQEYRKSMMAATQPPQPIYNIYMSDSSQTNISSEEIAQFSKDHGNYPYIVIKDDKPLLNICHKVNHNK